MPPIQKLIIFVGLSAIILEVSNGVVTSYYYKSKPCSNQDVADVLRSRILEKTRQRSMYLCAALCRKSQSNGCKHAVYRQSDSTCRLIAKTEVVNSLPDYVNQGGCTVIKPAFCDPLKFTCDCPTQFAGRFCEQNNPIHCQKREWRLATEHDYQMLATSQIPLKMVLDTEIMYAITFDTYNTTGINYVAQANGYLVRTKLNEAREDNSYQLSFLLYNPLEKTSLVTTMKNDGEVEFSTSNTSVRLYVPAVLDDKRLVYSEDFGSLHDVLRAISAGHQLLQRDFTRIDFNNDENDVLFQTFETRLALNLSSNLDWVKPLTYLNYQESHKTETRYYLNQQVTDQDSWNSFQEVVRPYREVDRCWFKITDPTDYKELISILVEYVKQFREIRMAIGGKMMSKVSEMNTFKEAIFAFLAPNLPQVITEHFFHTNSTSTTHSINWPDKKSECERRRFRFRLKVETEQDKAGTTEWYVSTRSWKKLYTVDQSNFVFFGKKRDVFEAAKQGRNIGLCFLTSEWNYQCTEGKAIETTSDDQVILQTSILFRITSNKCIIFIRVVSTDGWVKRINLNLGVSSSSIETHVKKTIMFVEL